jgi:hypothetical protein
LQQRPPPQQLLPSISNSREFAAVHAKNKNEIRGGAQQGPLPLLLRRRLPVQVLVGGLGVMSRMPHQHKLRQVKRQVKPPVLVGRLIRARVIPRSAHQHKLQAKSLEGEEERQRVHALSCHAYADVC